MSTKAKRSFEMGDYVDVAARIALLRERHPEASLRPLNPERPFEIVEVQGRTFVTYAAACYRTPDDPAPGVGVAWEPFPGPTPYTRDSELQNAETSAWGRAIVAALAADTRGGVASAEEVRNRSTGPAIDEALLARTRERLSNVLAAHPDPGADAWARWKATNRPAWPYDPPTCRAILAWCDGLAQALGDALSAAGVDPGGGMPESPADGSDGDSEASESTLEGEPAGDW